MAKRTFSVAGSLFSDSLLDNTFTPLQADATSVPEPLTLWLLAIGLLALTLSNRQQYTFN